MKDTSTLSELSELVTFLEALPQESQESFKEAVERTARYLVKVLESLWQP